jgi:hypothetical protein
MRGRMGELEQAVLAVAIPIAQETPRRCCRRPRTGLSGLCREVRADLRRSVLLVGTWPALRQPSHPYGNCRLHCFLAATQVRILNAPLGPARRSPGRVT